MSIDPKKVARANAKVPALMGAREAARVLNVSQTNLRKVVGLPEPAQVLACGSIWRVDVMEEFAAERRERLGLEQPAEAVAA